MIQKFVRMILWTPETPKHLFHSTHRPGFSVNPPDIFSLDCFEQIAVVDKRNDSDVYKKLARR